MAFSYSMTPSPTGSISTSSTRRRSSPRRRAGPPVGRLVLDRRVDNFFAETEQVAFCTQNIVPGIDFRTIRCCKAATSPTSTRSSNGSADPNFTHLPINAPKCPVAHFQQDGHMAMHNPIGRVNYEPNSLGRRRRSARIRRSGGFQSFPEDWTAQAACAARRRSPITTARPASSTSARRRSSRPTSPTPWCSN